jgi:hypothetical protein
MAVMANWALDQSTTFKRSAAVESIMVSGYLRVVVAFDELPSYMLLAATFVVIVLAQVARKEEDLEDGEHDEKLDEDEYPQGSPDGHRPESVAVEGPDPRECGVGRHGFSVIRQ